MKGVKFDEDKLDYTLIPKQALDEVVRVLMYGAEKYDRDNWKRIDDGRDRYNRAALRHLFSEVDGEDLDESTYFHLAHAAASCLFSLAFAIQEMKLHKDD